VPRVRRKREVRDVHRLGRGVVIREPQRAREAEVEREVPGPGIDCERAGRIRLELPTQRAAEQDDPLDVLELEDLGPGRPVYRSVTW